MRYHVLASDYDGTLAHHGRVDATTVASLKSLLASGRRLVLVTGRELPELLSIFPEIELFEWVVAENGGLLYRPSTKEEKVIAEPPPERFVEVLRARGVGPISVGRSIVATWEPHEQAVLETIRDLGLEMQVIFNKGAVMILPAGVNKATGLRAALNEMGVSPHNVVGVGDAENDHALLRACELSAAVQNALPAVKETADVVLAGDHGTGVAELIAGMVESDLADQNERLVRHHLELGDGEAGPVTLSPYGRSLLICGPSASGKSTVATRIVESLMDRDYQFCLVDPEGDYSNLEGPALFGGPKGAPVEEEILRSMAKPETSAVVSLTGMSIPDRPPFFVSLLSKLLDLRTRSGHPHWLVLDEAHHLMPAEWKVPDGVLPEHMPNVLMITVHPELLSPAVLERVDTVLSVGTNAAETIQDFARMVKLPTPDFPDAQIETGELLLWNRGAGNGVVEVKVHACKTERRRHSRKYIEGELSPERSFYFRGQEGKLKLRAQNLMLFLQLGEGLDDETWQFHLHQGDYSRWFRDSIKDENLAVAIERIEKLPNLSPKETRELVRSAIEQDYTLPASRPLPVPGAE